MERRFRELGYPSEEDHRIVLPGGHVTIGDFGYPAHQHAIYGDGAAFHSPGQATANWKRDLEITNDLQDEGWQLSASYQPAGIDKRRANAQHARPS